MKKLKYITRRDFLKKSLGAGLVLGSGILIPSCDGPHPPPQTWAPWEDVSRYIDGTLEGGFSFDLDLDSWSLYGDFVGHSFEQQIGDEKRRFTIIRFECDPLLPFEDPGPHIAFSLIENGISKSFDIGEMREIEIDGKRYAVCLRAVEEVEKDVPGFIFEVDGEEGIIRVDPSYPNRISGLNFDYVDTGPGFSFFLSTKKFDSRFDLTNRQDIDFSGLEKCLLISENSNIRRSFIEFKAENRYNGQVQEDAYVRVRGGLEGGLCGGCPPAKFVLKKIEKIRIPDSQETEECEIMPISIHTERENRIEHRGEDLQSKIDQTLKNGFSLEFPFPLEFIVQNQARFSVPRDSLSYEFSYELDGEQRDLVMRYLAINPKSNLALIEILEEPKTEYFEFGEPKKVVHDGEEYIVTLKDFGDVRGYLKMPDFVFDVERDGEKQEVIVSGADPVNSNNVLGLNIDPDLLYYFGMPEHEIRSMREHRLFLSREKVSIVDFYASEYFTGIKKQIVSDRNLTDPRFIQLTIANRYNGEIQKNAYSKMHVEFDGRLFVLRGLEKIVV